MHIGICSDYQVFIISMPFAINRLPVMPLLSQDGDQLHSMAILILFFNAISRVFSAPFKKYFVTSRPVTFLRSALSTQVSYTRPFKRFTAGRGTGRPPNNSGHTGMIST